MVQLAKGKKQKGRNNISKAIYLYQTAKKDWSGPNGFLL